MAHNDQNGIYPFKELQQEQLFQKLTHSLRCTVCPNQSIADSEAGLAVDLRNEIYHQVQSNRTETEVITFMTERFGDSILYQPPFNMGTVVLWLGPIMLVILGLFAFSNMLNFRKIKS